MKYIILTCMLFLLFLPTMQAGSSSAANNGDDIITFDITGKQSSSLNCLYVYFSPNAVSCGTTMITASVNCAFDGTIAMTVIGNPANVIVPNDVIPIYNGVFSFEVTVMEGAPSFIDVTTNVISISNDPNNCVITQTCEPSTMVTACSIPGNNDCENALELSIGLDNCDLFDYSNTLWTPSGMNGSCSDQGDEDVFFTFEATHEVVNLEFGELPSNSMTMELYNSCNGDDIYCASMGSHTTLYLNDLEIGSSYTLRIADLPGDNEGTFEMCLWSPLVCDLEAAVTKNQDEICFGDCNGIAEAVPLGGTGPYTFSWEDGDTNQIANNLCPGAHWVNITDINGCVAEASLIVDQGTQVIADAGSDIRICAEDSVILQASGGITYRWTPDIYLSDPNIANPMATPTDTTIYSVSVLDENGCKDSDDVLIAVTSNPQPEIIGDTLICFDASTTLSVDSSFSQIIWNTLDSTHQITISDAMTYQVTVMDTLGCSATDSMRVEKHSEIIADFEIDHESGYHFENGSIFTSVAGGIAPYQFSWSSGDTTATIVDLSPGNYSLNISDSVSCQVQHIISIDTFFCLPISMEYESSNVSCFGECDGRIQLTNIVNTQGAVQYNWSNGTNASEITDLCAGSYQVDITDSLNCGMNASFYLDEPGEIIIQIDEIIHARTGLPGSIDISTNGNYTYEWTGSDGYHSMEEDIQELEIGCYNLIVKDLLTNCTRDTIICIEDLTSTSNVSDNKADILLYPNPAKDVLNIDFSGSEIKEAIVNIADTNGRVLWTKRKTVQSTSLEVNTSTLIPGFYFLIVNDGDEIYRKRIVIRD